MAKSDVFCSVEVYAEKRLIAHVRHRAFLDTTEDRIVHTCVTFLHLNKNPTFASMHVIIREFSKRDFDKEVAVCLLVICPGRHTLFVILFMRHRMLRETVIKVEVSRSSKSS